MESSGALDRTAAVSLPQLVLRCGLGGLLMGLANLVPGISGGTMLLAAGVYPNFIEAIANVTRLKWKSTSIITLATIVVAAVAAILAFAGPVRDLVVNTRWVMYSLFIGLTLGGVPVVWRLASKTEDRSGVWAGAMVGFVLMAGLAYVQTRSLGGQEAQSGLVLMFVAGVAGASAMILPGISGGYLLLVLGVYVPILGAISEFKEALKSVDLAAAMGPGLAVILPVGLGVLVGVFAVSNGLRIALRRFEGLTLGALLGFLVGAVVGLWPFQRGVAPLLGTRFKGRVVDEALLAELEPHKYPSEFFSPSGGQVLAAIGLVALGFAITVVLAWLSRERPSS